MPSSLRPPRENTARLRLAPEEVSIDFWPLRDSSVESLLTIAPSVGLSWLASWITESSAAAWIVGALLTLTLWRTWLPVRYQLGAGGVAVSLLGGRKTIGWTAIQRYQIGKSGIWLYSDAASTPLASLRGCYLPWGRHRDAVIAVIEHYLPGLGNARRPQATGEAAVHTD